MLVNSNIQYRYKPTWKLVKSTAKTVNGRAHAETVDRDRHEEIEVGHRVPSGIHIFETSKHALPELFKRSRQSIIRLIKL